jgi:hypothetical protein
LKIIAFKLFKNSIISIEIQTLNLQFSQISCIFHTQISQINRKTSVKFVCLSFQFYSNSTKTIPLLFNSTEEFTRISHPKTKTMLQTALKPTALRFISLHGNRTRVISKEGINQAQVELKYHSQPGIRLFTISLIAFQYSPFN